MKRGDIVRHFAAAGCTILREGGRHTLYMNPANGKRTALSRQREIHDQLVREMCRQLGIDPPDRR